MIPKRLTLATVAGLTAALALTACGGTKSDNAQNTASDGQARAVSEGVQGGDAAAADNYGASGNAAAGGNTDAYGSSGKAAQAGFVTTALKAKKTATWGTTVVDSKNWTLYRFDTDKKGGTTSACNDDCAVLWPPIIADETPQLQGLDKDMVSTVVRKDGRKQLTLGGWPLYRYAKDAGTVKFKGHGVGGKWWAITNVGGKAVKCLPGMATAGNSWLRTKNTAFGKVVVDNKGMALYRFDQDSVKPSKSTCDGECEKKWPILKWPGQKPQLQGVDPALVGKVQRADGQWQVTLGGWPLYYFAQDKKAGDWKGVGVGKVWWAVKADGKKAGVSNADDNADDNAYGSGGY